MSRDRVKKKRGTKNKNKTRDEFSSVVGGEDVKQAGRLFEYSSKTQF